jgi:hypothetical protein
LSGKIVIKERWELLLYNTIKIKKNSKKIETYELSLFGILLVILLIRNHDMNKLRNGLFYKVNPFEDYYNKIASNYENNLPLIFKKWRLLKRMLKVFAAYNFDIILDKEFRDKAMNQLSTNAYSHKESEEVSVTAGNKELYENAQTVTRISHRQLGEIQIRGMEESFNFVERLVDNFRGEDVKEQRNIERQKTEAVFQLLHEITLALDPISYDPRSFREYMIKTPIINPAEAERLEQLLKIDSLERSFGEQISFLYYLNLNNDQEFQVAHPMNYYSLILDRWNKEYFPMPEKQTNQSNTGESNSQQKKNGDDPYSLKPSLKRFQPLSPKKRLLSILRTDNDLRSWFFSWIEELENYQNEMISMTRVFRKEIEALEEN